MVCARGPGKRGSPHTARQRACPASRGGQLKVHVEGPATWMPSGGEGCGSMQAGGGAAPELLGPAGPGPGPPQEALPGGEREAPGHLVSHPNSQPSDRAVLYQSLHYFVSPKAEFPSARHPIAPLGELATHSGLEPCLVCSFSNPSCQEPFCRSAGITGTSLYRTVLRRQFCPLDIFSRG